MCGYRESPSAYALKLKKKTMTIVTVMMMWKMMNKRATLRTNP